MAHARRAEEIVQDLEGVEAPNTVAFDEASLAEASIAGDTEAFEILYTHYFPKVRGFCLRKLGNADLAEDIAQEAFARAFERISEFGGPRHFGGWVGTIAANLCTDYLRRRKNSPIPLEDVERGPSYEIDPIRNIQREDTGRLVRMALEKLEPRHREALLLHEVKGLSCAAVGKRLGISEVAAESLLARARRRLRREVTAKAAPADLFGLGGLGLLPALLRAWRRAKDSVSRRLGEVQAAASRSFEGVAGGLVPALDSAKAIVVAVGAALAVEAASAAVAPGPKTVPGPASPAAAAARPLLPPDGSGSAPRQAAGAPQGSSANLPITASIDPSSGSGRVAGKASAEVPTATEQQAHRFGVDGEVAWNITRSSQEVEVRLSVNGTDGTILDTGRHKVAVRSPAAQQP